MLRLLVVLLSVLLTGCISAKPHTFQCKVDLSKYTYPYNETSQFDWIRVDACEGDYSAGKPSCGGASSIAVQQDALNLRSDKLLQNYDAKQKEALTAFSDAVWSSERDADGPNRPVLLLSGGGAWGAFGAGFLHAWHKGGRSGSDTNPNFPDFGLVTGISTGAIQSLFVVAEDYAGLKREYNIEAQSDIATKNSAFGILRRGSQYGTVPLRRKILEALCTPETGACDMLDRIAKNEDTVLLMGMVESKRGKLVIANISKLVSDDHSSDVSKQDLAECVTAITMASAAVPVQLQPVRIREGAQPTTYVDGGVRYSVFLEFVGTGAQLAKLKRVDKTSEPAPGPTIYVVRNGPTIVPPYDRSREGDEAAAVDEQPDALQVGKRSYSTIVNQNEVSSIASLRLTYPDEDIFVVTADGYNSLAKRKCGYSPRNKVFDERFMDCLIDWGKEKYDRPFSSSNRQGAWIRLPKVPANQAD